MNTFIEIPATKKSLSARSLIHGIGINDSKYQTQPKINGKRAICPIYKTWKSMLTRCYSKVYHNIRPTYLGCSICDEWALFSNFKSWMITQDWEGKALDKDLLISGSKIYSPETCIFVSAKINSLLSDAPMLRGDLPMGVKAKNGPSKYQASCAIDGKDKHIGTYSTKEKAHIEYLKVKSNNAMSIALQQDSEKLKIALIRISKEISNGSYYS